MIQLYIYNIITNFTALIYGVIIFFTFSISYYYVITFSILHYYVELTLKYTLSCIFEPKY